MLDWLTSHRETLGFGIDVGRLLVWIAYLQVFVRSFRRQRQTSILLGLEGGAGLDARCLVSNLSRNAIYIRSLILDLESVRGTYSHPVTELEDLEEWKEPSDLNLWSRQGPLGSRAVRDTGTIRGMLDHAIRATAGADAEKAAGPIDHIKGFRLTVIAHYGPEDLLVTAEQSYTIVRQDRAIALRPMSAAPRQIRSRQERRRVRTRLERIAASGPDGRPLVAGARPTPHDPARPLPSPMARLPGTLALTIGELGTALTTPWPRRSTVCSRPR